MKYPRLFLIALLFPCLVFSQREIMQADAAFEANRFFNSGQLYRKALTKKKTETDKGRIFFQIGECERLLVNPTAAQVYYSKAIGAAYPDCIVHFRLAQMQQMNGQYMAAIQSYDIYKNCAPSDPRAQEGIDACNLAVQWLSETTRWVITNEGQLNSNENDFCPTWSDRNHRSLVFSSKRAGQSGAKIDPNSGTLYSDLFEARINTNGKWSSPQAVQGGVNTPVSNDGASCITKNGSHIFFTRCDQQKKKVVTCKIYYAVKQGNGWGTPALIDFGLDAATLDSFNFRHPAVSLNEEVMVFSSDMPGSLGGVHSDLWISTYDRQTKSWGKPVNMGGAINTKGREGFPSIDESGDLYFSSDGHHGFGGLDIYKAPRLTTNQSGTWSWSKPVNMKVPFNSPADDFGIIFDGKKKKGYLTSNREGTKGRDDIWRFHLPPCNPVVSGKVIDTTAHVAVQNALVIIDYADNTQETKRTDAKGDFAFIVAEDETFVLSFRADSLTKSSAGVFYFTPPSAAFQNGKFTTVGLETCVDYKHNFVIGGV
ncbi:MAG TPA: hypothetical protein VI731_11395, partial [Bacteroidia bacterium]|nr:hypothetical protein [Bacteroidia bacterium]